MTPNGRLRLTDVFVLHRSTIDDDLSTLANDLREVLPSSTLLVVLDPGQTLEALDERDMRAAGWVRA